MPAFEKQLPSQLKRNDLRSGSPAVKRPASDMGAQDREEHLTDVEMEGNSPDSKAKQQDTGERHRQHDKSDPGPMQQNLSSDDSTTTTSNRSTTATSTDSPINIPSIDDQVAKVTHLVMKEIVDKQKGYLVSSKWIYRIQSRSSHPPEGRKGLGIEGEIGPLDNTDIAMVTEDSGRLKDEKDEIFVPLRPGLNMGEDYQILPQEAWDLVVQWYGIAKDSPIITRYAHDTNEAQNVQYELNPPIFSFLKVVGTHNPQTQKDDKSTPVRMLASRTMLVQDWLRRAKELINIDINTKVRVWRVLGGLKSTSGILTPAASRSASPAPGAELVANAGDRLILDVMTFAALQIGEHREKLEFTDSNADSKCNGEVTLGTIGLGRDDVIVLEEQKGTDWPSENLKLTLNKNINKTKGLTSGKSSPTPGMMTRGRQLQSGRPRGITGLSNLGNTCYMNSALQCIRSVEELTQYFLHDEWKEDLNVNNPLGHHGEVAKAYANLIKQIYNESSSSTNPSRFKSTIGKYGSSFSGYQQQDSQEFLLFLLDGLQEDLNRIHKKPYIEKPDSTDEMVNDSVLLKEFAEKNWEIYKARNDSVITDLFAGMYKSTLTCPVCDKVSIIFDPFNNLTLQLPVENTWAKDVIYFPLRQRPIRVEVDIDKHASFRALKEFIAVRTKSDPDRLFLAEHYQNRIYKIFDNSTTISEANIQPADTICCYELESIPTNYNPNKPKKYSIFTIREPDNEVIDPKSPAADRLLVPIFHRLMKNNTNKFGRPFFALPTYVIINREDNKSFDGVLRKLLNVVAGMTTKKIGEDLDHSDSEPNASSVDGEDEMVDISLPPKKLSSQWHKLFTVNVYATGEGIPTGWNTIDESKVYRSITTRLPKKASNTSEDELSDVEHDASIIDSETGLVHPGEAIILDWNQDGWDALFGGNEDDEDDEEFRGAPTWKNVSILPDQELAAKKAQRMNRRKNGVTLEDCLNEFGKSETLSENNAWYCPRCKKHRRADKMFELWKAPDILVMHLKRFSSNRNFRDKLEVKVEYPIEGLDLSTMVRDHEEGKSLIYDLIAVDNHYGGLGGGHYTAYAKNFVDNHWHEYNDSHVSSRQDTKSVITAAAYLLFYRRRSDNPLGGPKLEKLLEVNSENQTESRETSPPVQSGEGLRLDGSSQIGSSSAFEVDRTHQMGDGGLTMGTKLQNRGLTPEGEEVHNRQIDNMVGPPNYYDAVESTQEWSFSHINRPSVEDDMFGDRHSSDDSNRAVGSSLPGSTIDPDEIGDQMSFSDQIGPDSMLRNQRENAPPPYDFPNLTSHNNDEDDELPVMELKFDNDEPTFTPAMDEKL